MFPFHTTNSIPYEVSALWGIFVLSQQNYKRSLYGTVPITKDYQTGKGFITSANGFAACGEGCVKSVC